MESFRSNLQQRGASRSLVILLHAYQQSPEGLASLTKVVAAAQPDADIFCPQLPLGMFSFATQDEVVSWLLEQVDRIYDERSAKGSDYEAIVIVGHSMGALIGRKLYVCACGENDEAPFADTLSAPAPRPWAASVERVVLMAGMNRGWEIDHHLSRVAAMMWLLGIMVGNMLKCFRKGEPIIFTIRRGAVFLTELRIQWLTMRRKAHAKSCGNAMTIQLLGSIDDMVSPADNLDLISGRDFIYLDVPHSGHANIVEMDDPRAGAARAAIFRSALTAERDALEQLQVLPSDNPMGDPDEDVTDMVFVIHGIRDKGYWTHKIARRAKERGKRLGRQVATKTASYGYFPMLRFLIPGERQRKVQWFMDQYVEALAAFPNAEFSFVGHSHGTYLLAKSLDQYRCCRFRRVVFAGSVVRRQFDWEKFQSRGQVEEVANYVATTDWVVALFPKAIQMLRIQDLGSAGHDGFDSPIVGQVRFVKGTHAAAIQEENWEAIASFVVGGEQAQSPAPLVAAHQNPWLVFFGRIAPVVWLLVVAAIATGGWVIWGIQGYFELPQWATTLAYVGYLYAIWLVLTKG